MDFFGRRDYVTHKNGARTLGRWPEKSGLRHDRSRKLKSEARRGEVRRALSRKNRAEDTNMSYGWVYRRLGSDPAGQRDKDREGMPSCVHLRDHHAAQRGRTGNLVGFGAGFRRRGQGAGSRSQGRDGHGIRAHDAWPLASRDGALGASWALIADALFTERSFDKQRVA